MRFNTAAFRLPYCVKISLKVFFILLLAQTIARFLFVMFAFKESIAGKYLATYWLGLRYDARMAAIIALPLLILFFIKPLHTYQKKWSTWLFTLIFGIISLVLVLTYIIDFYFYDYRKDRLNADILNYFGGSDQSIGAGMVNQTYPVFKIIITLIVLSALLLFLFRRVFVNTIKQHKRGNAFSFLQILVVSIVYSYIIIGNLILYTGHNFPLRWSNAATLGHKAAKVAMNPFQSFVSSLKYKSISYNEAKAKAYFPLLQNAYGLPATNTITLKREIAQDTVNPMNVVLVICESFSAYKSSMFGNALNTTPYFKSLCDKGTFFTNCYTPAYGTARGVWATLTGIPDVQVPKDATRNPFIVNQHVIMNDIKNYEKFYFIGGSTTWANIRGLLLNNVDGLQLFEQDSYTAPKVDVWGISDKSLFLEANKKLKQQTKPFFAIIQTANNHRPYTIPKEDSDVMGLVNLSTDSLKNNGFENNNELNAFRYSDYCFKVFMETAAKEKYFDNTLFVFVGDHGIRYPGIPKNKLFHDSYYTEQLPCLHVPLLFYKKGMQPKQINALASQTDVMPTITGMLGVSYTNTTYGIDLFKQPIQNRAVFTLTMTKKK
jgi:phosphoglycerol transferase MdoB-like AlkP superfamily enzyme